jgi:hypothetical protein
MGQEGDDVVLHFASISSMRATSNSASFAFPTRSSRCVLRDHAELGLRVAGMGLDLEPDAELGSGDQMAVISGRE